MSKVEDYRKQLQALPEDGWDAFLRENSNLPGPRSNLELAFAAAAEASPGWLHSRCKASVEEAPENTPGCFVVCCATIGLGRLVAEGDERALERLRGLASDNRWRVRESVAIALQRLGDSDLERLLAVAGDWSHGSLLEQRAAVAAVCEPRLLTDERNAGRVLGILQAATHAIEFSENRRDDAFKTLRQALGYCWSVAMAAWPERGKPAFEALTASEDPDVRWIARENLKKNRLVRLDKAWVGALQARISEKT